MLTQPIKFIVGLLLFLNVTESCKTSKDQRLIYQIGRSWEYHVLFYHSNNDIKDTCSLLMEVKKGNLISLISGQKNLTYTYKDCCSKNMNESTGVEEDTNHVFIHPPRLECFAFTEITPMPAISLPVIVGSTKDISLRIVKSTFLELSGKTINQTQKVVGYDKFNYKGKSINVYIIEGENISHVEEFGKYTSKFLFNNELGFVFLRYSKPNGEIVEFYLTNTNY